MSPKPWDTPFFRGRGNEEETAQETKKMVPRDCEEYKRREYFRKD